MSNKKNKHSAFSFSLFLFFFFHFSFSIFSQSSTSSPYSRYGIGDIQQAGFAANSAMSGTGISLQNDSLAPFFINTINPASYASFRLTSFEFGFNNTTNSIQSTSTTSIRNNAALGYMAFGIPLKSWWGASFGLLPYSNKGYKLADEQTLENIGKVAYSYEGSGSINKVYVGNAFKIKNFALGANASYLFGTINDAERAVFANSNYLNTRINRTTSINDVQLDYGMQYTFKIDSLKTKRREKKDSLFVFTHKKRDIEDVKITLGTTFAFKSDLKANNNLLAETYLLDASGTYESEVDTIQNSITEGFVTLPLSIGAGIAIKKGTRWLVAADYQTQQWTNYQSLGVNTGLKNTTKIALGMQFVPAKSTSMPGNYWKKIQYRAGVKYYQSYLTLQNTTLDEYTFSLGVGLPVGRMKALQQYSVLHVAIEIGTRGTTTNNLVKEQLAKVTVGFTINDRWFIKPKID